MAWLTKIKAGLLVVKEVVPNMKKWIFSDGQFNIARALMLVALLLILIGSVHFIGVDNTGEVLELLDDASDIIGYAGG